MQFRLKTYIYTCKCFQCCSFIKVTSDGSYSVSSHSSFWSLHLAGVSKKRKRQKKKKGQQWGQRKEKQAVRFVRADECVSWELQGDQRWSPTEDLISETMEQQDTQHQPGWRRCWTARPRCRCWQQQGSHYQNGLLKESARFSVRSLVKLSLFLF